MELETNWRHILKQQKRNTGELSLPVPLKMFLNWVNFLKSFEMRWLNVELCFPKKACEQLPAE